MEPVHLWWDGDETLAPGRTAEEASRWMMQVCGLGEDDVVPAEEWHRLPDDDYLRDEDGSIPIPAETCQQVAQAWIESTPLRSAA